MPRCSREFPTTGFVFSIRILRQFPGLHHGASTGLELEASWGCRRRRRRRRQVHHADLGHISLPLHFIEFMDFILVLYSLGVYSKTVGWRGGYTGPDLLQVKEKAREKAKRVMRTPTSLRHSAYHDKELK